MPRALSDDTVCVLQWLWYLPWASASDIARVTGLKENAVSNVLSRGRTRGWLESARLGRTRDAVDRFVYSFHGVEEFHTRYDWEVFWWHTTSGVRSLARRLEIVEMAYYYLPLLWRSTLVTDRRCYVYRERSVISPAPGKATTRVELTEADWRRGKIVAFYWMDIGPFEAIITYDNGDRDSDLLHIPVLWRASFQKASDIDSVMWDMRRVFAQDQRWSWLRQEQAFSLSFCPGLVIFCPDRVSAGMVQRHWLESLTRDTLTNPAIIDAEGRMIRAMSPPTTWWEGFRLPRHGVTLDKIKDVSQVVRSLTSGAYAAVNGVRAWRTFRSIDGSPGVSLRQIVAFVGVDTTVASRLLDSMMKEKVVIVKGGGYYLDVSGRALLAYSQRVTPARVLKRWGDI